MALFSRSCPLLIQPTKPPKISSLLWSTPMKQKMTCGAHARSTGRPCQAMALLNGRCRNHGGCSTGAKTQAGRAAISAAAKARMTPEHKKRLSEGFQRWSAGGGWAWLSKLATARFKAKRWGLSVRVAPAQARLGVDRLASHRLPIFASACARSDSTITH